MRSERDAFLAAQQRHHQYMVFGKKQRYIEVFQCSGDDMNHLLTGSTPLSAAAASQAAALAAAVASQQAKNPNAATGLLPPGMFPAFPNLHAPAAGGMDPAMAAQLHSQLQFLAAPNLAALGSVFPPGFPPSAAAAANIRPPALPAALPPPFPSPGQLRSPFPSAADPASLWAAAGLPAPILSMSAPPPSGGLATPQQQQQQQAAAFFNSNFGLHNFLLQPPGGQMRLPTTQASIVVSTAGGLSPQNAALLQSQLAAQRVLMQQQQQQQPLAITDPASLGLPRPGIPGTAAYLPPMSLASPIPPSVYTSVTSGAPKRTFDQAFVAAGPNAASQASAGAGKRINYGYGVIGATPPPTISAAPTSYYATTPNPS